MARVFFDFCPVSPLASWSAYILAEREWDYAIFIDKVPEWLNWYVFQTFGLRSSELTETLIKFFSSLNREKKAERVKELMDARVDFQLRILRNWGIALPTIIYHSELFSFLGIDNSHLRVASWLWNQPYYSASYLLSEIDKRGQDNCRHLVLHLLQRELYTYLSDIRTDDLLNEFIIVPPREHRPLLLTLIKDKKVKQITISLPLSLSLSEKGIQIIQLRLLGDYAIRRFEWEVCNISRLSSRNALITMGTTANFKRLLNENRESLCNSERQSEFENCIVAICRRDHT